jgi:hypothetical protein
MMTTMKTCHTFCSSVTQNTKRNSDDDHDNKDRAAGDMEEPQHFLPFEPSL